MSARKKDIAVWRGDNAPAVEWSMPFDVTGYSFTLTIQAHDSSMFSVESVDGSLTVDESDDTVSWTYDAGGSAGVPPGKNADYELRSEVAGSYQTRFYGAVTGLGGLTV